MLVVRRTGQDVDWTEGRDVWWDDVVARQSAEHTPEAHEHRSLGDVTTLTGSTVMELISEQLPMAKSDD